MIRRDNCIEAIAKCTGYDPMHSPRQSELIANAWSEHFAQYPELTRDDLLDAVKEYYRTPQRPWPQPADISSVARVRHRDIADRAPLPEIECVPASAEYRAAMVAEIRQTLAKKWSMPKPAAPCPDRPV